MGSYLKLTPMSYPLRSLREREGGFERSKYLYVKWSETDLDNHTTKYPTKHINTHTDTYTCKIFQLAQKTVLKE